LMRAHQRLRTLLEARATAAPSYGEQHYADGPQPIS
jgi:hypothetical protein